MASCTRERGAATQSHTATQLHRTTELHRATVLPQYLQISNFSHKVSECVTAAATVSRKAKDTFYTKYAQGRADSFWQSFDFIARNII